MSCRPRQAPSFTNFSFSFLSDLTEFYRFWTGFYRVLPSFTGFHCFACVCGMYRHWMSFKSRAWSCFVEGFVLFAGPLLLRFFFFFWVAMRTWPALQHVPGGVRRRRRPAAAGDVTVRRRHPGQSGRPTAGALHLAPVRRPSFLFLFCFFFDKQIIWKTIFCFGVT